MGTYTGMYPITDFPVVPLWCLVDVDDLVFRTSYLEGNSKFVTITVIVVSVCDNTDGTCANMSIGSFQT